MEKKRKIIKSYKRNSRKTVYGIKLPPIEPDADCHNVRTPIDIDPVFFSMIDGRPIRPNTSIQTYKKNIRDIALKRTLNGFVNDEIMRIEREIESESIIFEKASKHFDEYQNSFDKFLAYDNNVTINIMKKSDCLAKELVNLTEDQKQLNYEMASVKSKLQYIDESLMILRSFENFLHKASPLLWQESQNVVLDEVLKEMCPVSNDIFQKINVSLVKDKLDALPPPRLYFKTPEQLQKIFYLLEKQNLNSLLVAEELTCEKNNFIKASSALKNLLYKELNLIQEQMKDIEDTIRWNEVRESELKEIFYRILEVKMRDLISSDMALKLYNYVEYAYEKLITPNDTSLNTIDMVLALENEYNNIMLDLSVFDLDELYQMEKKIFDKGVSELKQAREANRLLKDVDKLSKRLKSSYEASRKPIE